MKAVSKVLLGVFSLALPCVGLQLGNSQSAMAQDFGCTNATLKGHYIFDYDGWNIAGGKRTPIAYAGQEDYDGNGKFRGVATYSVDGVITRNEAYTGTYTVKPDCTAPVQEITTQKHVVTHFDYFISPAGDEFVFVQTDRGTAAAGIEFRARRVGQ